MCAEPIVVLKDVYRDYPMGQAVVKALDGVHLEVGSGEFAALVGSFGSGKSTFLNLIAGIHEPTACQVIVVGRDLGGLSEQALPEQRGRTVGIVFQAFNLIPAWTAVENMALLLVYVVIHSAERKRRARELLSTLGLRSWLHHRPGELSGW